METERRWRPRQGRYGATGSGRAEGGGGWGEIATPTDPPRARKLRPGAGEKLTVPLEDRRVGVGSGAARPLGRLLQATEKET